MAEIGLAMPFKLKLTFSEEEYFGFWLLPLKCWYRPFEKGTTSQVRCGEKIQHISNVPLISNSFDELVEKRETS